MWRSKDWENPYMGKVGGDLGNVYEAGADAMLKDLKKERSLFEGNKCMTYYWDKDGENGWLVHIPEEENEGKAKEG